MAILVDSCVFIALFSDEDTQHHKAVRVFEELKESIYISYGVILETVTVLTYRASRDDAVAFLEYVLYNKNIIVLNDDVYAEMNWFCSRKERISFTDAALLFLAKTVPAELITFDKQLGRLYKKSARADLI